MANTKLVPQMEDDTPSNGRWTKEEAERFMTARLAHLPPPPSIEELARVQGVRLPQRVEDLILEWPESEWDDDEDSDIWESQQRERQLQLQQERYTQLFPNDAKP